jgi:predicted ATP-grasp superfamily ATP-dependent carboligase
MKNGYRWLTAISALAIFGAGEAAPAAECDGALTRSLQDAGQRLAHMQVTKPGQARVFASDGTEYSAAAVRRMRAQLGLAERACDRGDARAASGLLDAIKETLRPPATPAI